MRFLQLLAVALFVLLLAATPQAAAVVIPAYTPNVVDPGHVLGPEDTRRVNQALQQLRDDQHIWGAVYIVPSLEQDDIDALSARAFKQWGLGQHGADNGLLLVLAIQERRSRFEVGYGLEGSLPDIAAKHALDEALAPRMRQGDTAAAIIDAFGFMARVAAKDPATIEALAKQTNAEGAKRPTDMLRGFLAWAGLLVVVWLLPPVQRWWTRRLRDRLLRQDPSLKKKTEEIATPERKRKRGFSGGLFLQLFATLNPGIFVLILSALFAPAFMVSIGLEVLVFGLTLWMSGRRYRSPERFRSFLKSQDRKRNALIRRGHVIKTDAGGYAYTAAYHASQHAASSSSSSDSGSSSSSGGGSSGGGGASSSW
ncbi:TPM domain-containing protein [Pseudoxanthomonas sp.]|uniref:TPM domain-containing protein n=1 Tax=Pseudoxanthomonas sp. TaxID=1871049 RepID=UPI0026301D69|nr:TPM domain-containing protein [Pseudoxanthomonas sp.]WDS36174.1 MAG: TPM domain-containing protein [Pseudoxanthomonas sp.]